MSRTTASSPAAYSPTVCVSAKKARVIGNPDMGTVSTSIVERANLDIRPRVRRFTRLTNGYSKKAENHAHAFSLDAMAAELGPFPWTMLDVVERMNDEREVFA